jgi:peptidoglycan hydrolase CwlO-like protein
MKLLYIDNNGDLIFTEYNSSHIPRIDDKIWLLQDIWHIHDIIWYPKEGEIRIYLTEEEPKKVKVAESKENKVQLDIEPLKKDINKALKETSSLTRQVASMKQHINYQQQQIDKGRKQ